MEDREFYRIFDEVLKRPACIRRTEPQVPARVYRHSARLNHPHILSIYEVREDALITEAVAGTRLSDFLEIPGDRRAFTSRFQEMFILPLLGALSYAHRCGLVHGFLHPGNIWLLPDDQLKVWGFGFALLEAARGDSGWDFAAPEVRVGEKPTACSDIWSAAAILYLLFSGCLPGPGWDAGVPEELRPCLVEDPAHRCPTFDFLRADFLPSREFEMDPAEAAVLHTTLGNNYFRRLKVELAVMEWEKALAVYPEERIARNNLGVALWRWGRLEEAAECFRRCGSFLNLGLLLWEEGDYAAALEPLRTSIVLEPHRAGGYLALGECFLGLGKGQQALEEFQKSFILTPFSSRSLRGMAAASELLGKTGDAAQFREKSLETADQEICLEPIVWETPLGRQLD